MQAENKLPWDMINLCAAREAIDPALVAAIITQESSGDRFALRYEPNYIYLYKPQEFARRLNITYDTEVQTQKFSYSYMQIMGAVARELGFEGPAGCLFDEETAIHYGCKHLARFLRKFKLAEAIASYNAGSPRYLPGTTVLVNQHYVDSVLALQTRFQIKGGART